VDSITPQHGTQAAGHEHTSGRDEDLDERHGVSIYSSSLLQVGILSSFSLSSIFLSRLVDRLVALHVATLFLLGLRVFLVAISKLMCEVC